MFRKTLSDEGFFMKQKMTRFLNHENLENQLILLRKNHMISSNLPTKIREEPFF